ncbi:MAG: 1,2-phenylacetyl-CoA epoxidase subunit PaaD [Bacillus sp. (in: firmicutes)]
MVKKDGCGTDELHKQVMDVLRTVKDPEIDTVSIIDLGMVERISIEQREDMPEAVISILPTFLGCPALEIIRRNIQTAVEATMLFGHVGVEFLKAPPWTSDRITAQGAERLKEFGIAPPPIRSNEDGSWHVNCPYCHSEYVTMENIFGPTACRSILYCRSCKNPFEAMKPISNL